jgi:GTP1/Obg family GTP-binding protein
MTKETRFAPKQMKAVDEVIDKCDKTISVVTNFIETTTNPDDLPAVHNHLTNIVADASNLRTSAVMTKRQMEILNATLD